jgi:hypothetical protein
LADAVIVFGAGSAVEPPVIDVGRSGLGQDGFHIVFSSQAGVRYTVEYANELGFWSPLQAQTADGAQSSCLDRTALGLPHRFYRVKVTP